mmetsp:Transcript_55095/g.126544  ORF Transcript_55095/g.126544 Transcript_55095/m.126544 type:complete len:147 (+) Transcript_55095:314-754(+)
MRSSPLSVLRLPKALPALAAPEYETAELVKSGAVAALQVAESIFGALVAAAIGLRFVLNHLVQPAMAAVVVAIAQSGAAAAVVAFSYVRAAAQSWASALPEIWAESCRMARVVADVVLGEARRSAVWMMQVLSTGRSLRARAKASK